MPQLSRPARTLRLTAVVAASALGLSLVVGAVRAETTHADTTNLAANPGFESGTLSGWSCDSGTAKVVTTPVHSGSYALNATPSSSDDAQCAQTVSVQPNSAYTLSAWVQGPYVYLGVTGSGSDTSTWTTSTAWSQLSTHFTTGSGVTSVTIYLHGWYGQSLYDADDVTLTGPGGSSPSPTPTPTPTVTPPSGGSFTHPVYFMPLDNNPQSIGDIVSGSGENQFNLAFVLDSGGCTPAWDGDAAHTVAADTTVAADINAIRAAGGDAAVSFGGYNGTELGSSCGGTAALTAAYQAVITKYKLTRVDFDYENTALDANTGVRFGAIKALESANPSLKVSLTIPMTTIGFPDSGKDEIRQAIAAGARLDVINIMDFDTGLTSGTETGQTETIANDAVAQLQSLYAWSASTAWSHLGLQIMNGHTDQPSELFTQDAFTTLLGFAQQNHPAWFSYWSVNRDRACDPSVPHNWADGSCSSVPQSPWNFTKIIVRYTG